MKINKSSIASILDYHRIPSLYEKGDYDCDPQFELFGKYAEVTVSCSRGLAMVSKFDSNGAMWDLMVNDSDKLFAAIVEISAK